VGQRRTGARTGKCTKSSPFEKENNRRGKESLRVAVKKEGNLKRKARDPNWGLPGRQNKNGTDGRIIRPINQGEK